MSDFPEVNMGAYSGHGKKNSRGLDFFKIPNNSFITFCVLPPWNNRGLFAREVMELFGLPNKRRHTMWRTFDTLEPGTGEKDPVMKAVSEVVSLRPDVAIRESTKFYVNAIVHGMAPLTPGPNGVQKGTYQVVSDFKVQTLGLTPSAFNRLIQLMGMPGVGSITNPRSAVPVMLTTVGTGQDTRYTVELAGQSNFDGTFLPNRINLYDEGDGCLGLKDKIDARPDLDKAWPVPSEEDKVRAARVATEVRAAFGIRSVPGVAPMPGGMVGFAAPPPPSSPWGVPTPPAGGTALPTPPMGFPTTSAAPLPPPTTVISGMPGVPVPPPPPLVGAGK